MPSHTSKQSRGTNKKRNAAGEEMLIILLNWRANRSADALAKQVIKPFRLDKASLLSFWMSRKSAPC